MSERAQRLAANEAYFREINERVEEQVKEVAGEHALFNILCECSSMSCADRLGVTPAEYEQAHADPRQFIVALGHAQSEVEISVLRTDRFEIVRKQGEAGDVAARAASA